MCPALLTERYPASAVLRNFAGVQHEAAKSCRPTLSQWAFPFAALRQDIVACEAIPLLLQMISSYRSRSAKATEAALPPAPVNLASGKLPWREPGLAAQSTWTAAPRLQNTSCRVASGQHKTPGQLLLLFGSCLILCYLIISNLQRSQQESSAQAVSL